MKLSFLLWVLNQTIHLPEDVLEARVNTPEFQRTALVHICNHQAVFSLTSSVNYWIQAVLCKQDPNQQRFFWPVGVQGVHRVSLQSMETRSGKLFCTELQSLADLPTPNWWMKSTHVLAEFSLGFVSVLIVIYLI